MKSVLLSGLVLIFCLCSCKQQKPTAIQKVEEQETFFRLVEGSRQRIYPGQQASESKYSEHWILVLEGPANQFAQLKLVVSGCEIILPDLSEKGVVLGTDTKNYVVEFDIPDSQINSCLISSTTEGELVIDQGFRSEVVLINDINNKEAVFLPSSMD
jgi:hypothetical protein